MISMDEDPSPPQNQQKTKHPRSPSSSSQSLSATGPYKFSPSRSSRRRSRLASPDHKRPRRHSSDVTSRKQKPRERGVDGSYPQHEKSPLRRQTLPSRGPDYNFIGGTDQPLTPSVMHPRYEHQLLPNQHRPPPPPNASLRSSETGTNRENEDSRRVSKINPKFWKTQNTASINVPEYDTFQNLNDCITQPSTQNSSPPTSNVRLHRAPRYTSQFSLEKTWTSDASVPGKTNQNQTLSNPAFRSIKKGGSSPEKPFPTDEKDTLFASEDLRPSHRTTQEDESHASTLYHHTQQYQHLKWENSIADKPWSSFDPCSSGQRVFVVTPILPLESRLAVNNHERPSPRPMKKPQIASQETVFYPAYQNKASSSVGSSSNKGPYKVLRQVGEGAYGKVYKAQNTVSGNYIALKCIQTKKNQEGFPVTSMREIKILQSLQHHNVVKLYEMMVSNGLVCMVLEYVEHDLAGILSQTQVTLRDEHLKSICLQMLAGLAYLHRKRIIHRDIKGSNILINNRGEVKLADFGLARSYRKGRPENYTNHVITLWYRAPELLLGATVYGPEVDMWSAGCIMLELFAKKPVFQGPNDVHQPGTIYKLMGTLTPERWTGVVHLPWYELIKPQQILETRFRDTFQKWMSPAALDLAEQLLHYDPVQRITAQQAMDFSYFTSEAPGPVPPIELVNLEREWHASEGEARGNVS